MLSWFLLWVFSRGDTAFNTVYVMNIIGRADGRADADAAVAVNAYPLQVAWNSTHRELNTQTRSNPLRMSLNSNLCSTTESGKNTVCIMNAEMLQFGCGDGGDGNRKYKHQDRIKQLNRHTYLPF